MTWDGTVTSSSPPPPLRGHVLYGRPQAQTETLDGRRRALAVQASPPLASPRLWGTRPSHLPVPRPLTPTRTKADLPRAGARSPFRFLPQPLRSLPSPARYQRRVAANNKGKPAPPPPHTTLYPTLHTLASPHRFPQPPPPPNPSSPPPRLCTQTMHPTMHSAGTSRRPRRVTIRVQM